MFRPLALALLLPAAAGLAAPVPPGLKKPPPPTELDGVWDRVEGNGKPTSSRERWVIDGPSLTIFKNNSEGVRQKKQIYALVRPVDGGPNELDCVTTNARPKTLKCLVVREGDKLRLCLPIDASRARPDRIDVLSHYYDTLDFELAVAD